mgnify:CR=1 FL=1
MNHRLDADLRQRAPLQRWFLVSLITLTVVWVAGYLLHDFYHDAVLPALGLTARVVPFIDDMDQAYRWADLVVCRAGAMTIAELAAAGILFLGVFVIVTVATSTLAKAIHRSGEIGALDRGAGLAFGAARGILALALFVVLWHHITGPSAPMPDWLAKARTYPALNVVANGLETLIPKAQDYINEKRKAESAAPT